MTQIQTSLTFVLGAQMMPSIYDSYHCLYLCNLEWYRVSLLSRGDLQGSFQIYYSIIL